MSKLKPLICPQCGGTINRATRKCEYCGTEYRHYMSLNLDDVYEQGWADLQLCIEHMQSAQPERKKGQWIWWYEEAVTEHATEYTPHCKCSECGRECAPSVATSSNFCRNCGADMRGESE